jgi:hypothetical protein
MSNHRDIVLDSSFLSVILLNNGLESCETGIGDNLLIRPWITDFVRANKSFVVKRNLSVREQLSATIELSAYIRHTLQEKKTIYLAGPTRRSCQGFRRQNPKQHTEDVNFWGKR